MWLLYVIIGAVVVRFLLIMYSNKFVNPYFIEMYFAPPGVGKTMLLNKLAYKHRKNWTVYSTSHDIYGTYIEPSDIGKFRFPSTQNNLLIIDEVSSIYNNRDYKSFGADLRKFWKHHRKMHIKCIMASQDFEDVDKVLRKLTTRYYCLDRVAGLWIRGRRIKKVLTLTQAVGSESGNISDGYEYAPFLSSGSRVYAYLPYWVKRADSFATEHINYLPTMAEFYQKKKGA